jgi:hypothetical protein
MSLALPEWRKVEEADMQAAARLESRPIQVQNHKLNAVECRQCGAKIYPLSFLKAHLLHHKTQERWLAAELKRLRYIMDHMRYFR